MMSGCEQEVKQGLRFQFGQNWKRFLSGLNAQRIEEAEKSIKRMLEAEDLRGKNFLDIGSGSGLSSLAARRLGARVHSFDYDPESVACTQYLKQRFFPDDSEWVVEEGSVLDTAWLRSLGKYDIVYSWGVLHHTGSMWEALDNIDPLVAPGGKLFVAIYNDQGRASSYWRMIKKLYNRLPGALRFVIILPVVVLLWGPKTMSDLFRGRPFHTWRTYTNTRGMSAWWDVVDWVGGYPFEVAKPEAILDFYNKRGYRPQKLKTCGRGLGCNEFVFKKL
jgi:2-polyprenyl-3-methyl-5-hydroxy-6-metoxy-1,4-benzoquinol methylase